MCSKFVIKYNLTSLRSRVEVQAFFGRPITRLRLEPTSASCVSRPCLRFSVVKGNGGDVGLVVKREFAELKIEDLDVDGLVLKGLKGAGIGRDRNLVDEHVVGDLMAADRWDPGAAFRSKAAAALIYTR